MRCCVSLRVARQNDWKVRVTDDGVASRSHRITATEAHPEAMTLPAMPAVGRTRGALKWCLDSGGKVYVYLYLRRVLDAEDQWPAKRGSPAGGAYLLDSGEQGERVG